MIKLYFPVEPVAKSRPRMTRRGHVYTPQKTKEFEEKITNLAIAQMHLNNHKPLDGALAVKGYFFVKKPKRPKHTHPIGRPDIDNMLKALFDALNGVTWKDDSQICSVFFRKIYSDIPSITLFISEET